MNINVMTIIKILAVIAVIAIAIMLWTKLKNENVSPPTPYEAMTNFMGSHDDDDEDDDEDDDDDDDEDDDEDELASDASSQVSYEVDEDTGENVVEEKFDDYEDSGEELPDMPLPENYANQKPKKPSSIRNLKKPNWSGTVPWSGASPDLLPQPKYLSKEQRKMNNKFGAAHLDLGKVNLLNWNSFGVSSDDAGRKKDMIRDIRGTIPITHPSGCTTTWNSPDGYPMYSAGINGNRGAGANYDDLKKYMRKTT
jgi:hypothetical protein